MKKKKYDPKFRNGFSNSAWKSLVVKSLRIGWVEGLHKASENLPASEMINLLICGLFEDVFPAGYEEINNCYDEIVSKDYESLCKRNTHHGKGYSNDFVDYAEEACSDEAKSSSFLISRELINETKLTWINPRVYNCLFTWYQINPEKKEGYYRKPFHMEFKGMPKNILDGHTYEGKKLRNEIALLSGHYENHLKIGQRVKAEGWEKIRQQFENDVLIDGEITELTLF